VCGGERFTSGHSFAHGFYMCGRVVFAMLFHFSGLRFSHLFHFFFPFAVFAAFLNELAVGDPFVPGLRIFSPLPALILARFL
tara:strand:- start:294 stop:539 length:246 start_codon:yes stop_codon:yes gene_type:complete